jgi:hypothetical protein
MGRPSMTAFLILRSNILETRVAPRPAGGRNRYSLMSEISQRELRAECGRADCLPACGSKFLVPIHTGAQGGEFTVNKRRIYPLEPLGWYLDRSRNARKSSLSPFFILSGD